MEVSNSVHIFESSPIGSMLEERRSALPNYSHYLIPRFFQYPIPHLFQYFIHSESLPSLQTPFLTILQVVLLPFPVPRNLTSSSSPLKQSGCPLRSTTHASNITSTSCYLCLKASTSAAIYHSGSVTRPSRPWRVFVLILYHRSFHVS
jgi:hypothetical protein